MNDNLPLMNAVIVIWLLNVHILLFFFKFLFRNLLLNLPVKYFQNLGSFFLSFLIFLILF